MTTSSTTTTTANAELIASTLHDLLPPEQFNILRNYVLRTADRNRRLSFFMRDKMHLDTFTRIQVITYLYMYDGHISDIFVRENDK